MCESCESKYGKDKKVLKFKKLHPDAIIPEYKTKGSAAFDFSALILEEDIEQYQAYYREEEEIYIKILPGSKGIVRTGLAVDTGVGYKLDITPRSGHAFKNSITIINSPGKIDEDYRGEILVILFNLGDKPFLIRPGDRIAQCEWRPYHRPDEIIEVDELGITERGEGGFGSTGN